MGIENRDKTTTERNDSREGGMTEDNQKISSQVIAWATGQPFNNVLLLAILFAIGWSGYYTVTGTNWRQAGDAMCRAVEP